SKNPRPKGEKTALVFTLGVNLMETVHFSIGDRVDVLYDSATRMGMIKKVQTGGYLLSNKQGGKKASKSRVRFSIVWKEGMPIVDDTLVIDKVTTIDDGFMFQFPPSQRPTIQLSDRQFSSSEFPVSQPLSVGE
ncbi:MAG: hypothetical protein AB1847_22455, partial [bacterium]